MRGLVRGLIGRISDAALDVGGSNLTRARRSTTTGAPGCAGGTVWFLHHVSKAWVETRTVRP
ncbi:MAG: hypothetical protein QM756_44655 [Polyangiaceae bacterium]